MATIEPTDAAVGPAFRAMSRAVLSIAAELRLDPVLAQLAEAARELVGARYAAIGIPDGDGGFASFIPSGMSEAQLDALGELPRMHGLLGAMLESTEPYRTADVRSDPRYEGWPDEHPTMRSFLGVPIVARGEIIGAVYLTEKAGERHGLFTDDDVELIQILAAHAAIAIENARLYESSRELSIVEERKRLARELHDSVVQSLYAVSLTAEGAARQPGADGARDALLQIAELARGAMDEMRGLIFELRPAVLEQDGLVPALRKHAEVLCRVHAVEIAVEVDGERRLDARTEQGLFRIAQEALGNSLKHAGARRVDLRVAMPDGRVAISVCDDGEGFEPDVARRRSGRLGLTSMQERAEALGAELSIDSSPAAGTTVSVVLAV